MSGDTTIGDTTTRSADTTTPTARTTAATGARVVPGDIVPIRLAWDDGIAVFVALQHAIAAGTAWGTDDNADQLDHLANSATAFAAVCSAMAASERDTEDAWQRRQARERRAAQHLMSR